MVYISEGTVNDFKTIRDIAYKTWPVAYADILSKNQLEYMLKNFYSDDTLYDNLIHKKQYFLLAYQDLVCVGFASYEHHYLDKNCTRIHKLYRLPESKAMGIGRSLLNRIIDLAKENNSDSISLNVNRFNTAFDFYKKMGFEVVGEENLEIGNGYLMEDYKMEKKI